jgi:dephospho-CoA kinase
MNNSKSWSKLSKEHTAFGQTPMKPLSHFLNERLIVVNRGKRTGQVIFLAGGGGSGKGFVFNNMVDSSQYKVLNPDDFKAQLIALGKGGVKGYEKYADMSLRNPDHVAQLHVDVDNAQYGEKQLRNILRQTRSELPNLCFDRTMKSMGGFYATLPQLFSAGYKPQDIHVIWVLTDYQVALKQNATRSRTVPEEILLQGHSGAAVTMKRLIFDSYPDEIDGEVYVVLGGPGNTVFWTDPTGKPLGKGRIVKDFTYLKVKESGREPTRSSETIKQLLGWIKDYAPPGTIKD